MRKVIVLIVIIVICFAGASCEFYGCYGIGYECLDMCDTSSDSKKSLMLKYKTDFVLNARITEIVDEEVYSYFDGNQSAEKAVSNIQNRITILVSENS